MEGEAAGELATGEVVRLFDEFSLSGDAAELATVKLQISADRVGRTSEGFAFFFYNVAIVFLAKTRSSQAFALSERVRNR